MRGSPISGRAEQNRADSRAEQECLVKALDMLRPCVWERFEYVSGPMFHSALKLNALPVPLLRQVCGQALEVVRSFGAHLYYIQKLFRKRARGFTACTGGNPAGISASSAWVDAL